MRPKREGGKSLRTFSLKGGGTILEESVARDDAGRNYTYAILESPLPVEDYESTIRVLDDGGTVIAWNGTFAAKGAPDADAIAVIAGIYDAGLASLAEKVKN